MNIELKKDIYRLILHHDCLSYNTITHFESIHYIWLKLYKTYKLKRLEIKHYIVQEIYEPIENKINILINIQKKLPEQRSNEWYSMRHNMITASDLHKVLGTQSAKRNMLISKSSILNKDTNHRITGKACEHGIKYERVACLLYELRNKVHILDFGCIPHFNNTIPFGASPDGICDLNNKKYAGRMLEIKCPYSRIINGKISDMYWKQIQGQLEVCNLEECDFLECKITEYVNEEEFYEDGDEIKQRNNLEKGLILNYSEYGIVKYIYADIGLCKKDIYSFIEKEKEKIANNHNTYFIGLTWWKLDIYSCILIKRDREWFESILPSIHSFWEEVEKYRICGNQELKKEIKKKTPSIHINICLID